MGVTRNPPDRSIVVFGVPPLLLSRWSIALAASLAALLATPPLAGQTVPGRLLVASEDAPIGGALVQLFDSAGAEVARAASTPSGGYALAAPGPGSYRAVVRQIGQQAWRSSAFDLSAGAAYPLTIRIEPQPYTLPPITVSARRSWCDIRLDDDDLLGRLLNAAGTALGVAEATSEGREVGFSTDTYLKRLSPEFAVQDSAATDMPGLARWPIQSAPPDSLREWGFVRVAREREGPVYYGPDARVLFSDWFLASHCFEVDTAGEDLVRVRFEPEQRASLELRALVFEYVGLPGWVPKGAAGGELQLRRLPGGAWVPYVWQLRAPVPIQIPGRARLRLHGWLGTGGRVTAVRGGDGRVDPALTSALLDQPDRGRRY